VKFLRSLVRRDTLRQDAVAGLVLGVESVPDGLAGGLLAGVNPVYGLYAYMVGTFTGGLFTSSSFMAVQATGAMAIVVTDIGAVHNAEDPGRMLFTLSVVTGLVMLAAGLFKLGSMLRFVSNAVMVGFINAVGVNIILGQLDNFTGYDSVGANRVWRAVNTIVNFTEIHGPTLIVGVSTIALILLLERTKLGPLGMVAGIVIGSAMVPIFGSDIAQLRDIAEIPRSLPMPMLPLFGQMPALIVPALSLAFIGLVQGAGISASFPDDDGNYPDASKDFLGQGAANIAVGVFQGMPVGGSMSASSLVKTAGARSRTALLIAGGVIAAVTLLLADLVGYIAMPALAGLLMLVGFRTIKPQQILAVWKTGTMQATVMAVTFVLTMIIPLQNAVLVGVGISMILFIINQSNRVTLKRWELSDEGNLRESDPPESVGGSEIMILQPYGSLFFASAPVFEELLPAVTNETQNSVVILRLRGRTDLGSTFMEVVRRYAEDLNGATSKLLIITSDDQTVRQLHATHVVAAVGQSNLYPSDEWVGSTLKRAHADARAWIAGNDNNEDETNHTS